MYIALVHIITIKGNIQHSIVYVLLSGYFPHQFCYAARHPYTSWLYAYNSRILKSEMVFNQLMCQPLQRYIELFMIQQGLQTM